MFSKKKRTREEEIERASNKMKHDLKNGRPRIVSPAAEVNIHHSGGIDLKKLRDK